MTSPVPPAPAEAISALLDGESRPDELDAVLRTLGTDAQSRDTLTVYQLIKDAVGGVRAPDDGYSQRILARWRAQRMRGGEAE